MKLKALILGAFLGYSPLWAIDQAIGPFGGLNNTDNAATIPADKAQDLLNVDLSDGGRSVLKRDGYGLAYALSITTSPVHGVHNFFDSSGNDVALAFNDTRMTASINGGSATVLFSTGPNGATYQCTDSQGFAYCVNTTRNNVIKTNGQTYSFLTTVSTGTMITVTPDRLVQSGIAAAPNRVDFSAAADFTSWTTGVAPTSAFQFTISAPGARVTHIAYAFNRVMWFKDASFGYIIQGQTAADWVVQTVSPNVGTLDNTSVYYQGILYFRGQDSHIWSYDGSNLVKLTRDIGGTISASQSRAANSWTQTTQADFQAGISTPTAYLSFTISTNSVVLSTANSISFQTDTTSANFAAGTLTNVSTTNTNGSLTLAFTSTGTDKENLIGAGGSGQRNCSPSFLAQQFIATSSYTATSVTLELDKNGSPGNYLVYLMSDNSNTIGGALSTGTLASSSAAGFVNVTFDTPQQILSGSKYWIKLISDGTCNSGAGGDYFAAVNTLGSYSEYYWGGVSYSQATRFNLKIIGKDYSSSGNLVSRHFDVGTTTNTILWNWCELGVNGSLNGQTLTFETQTSSSSTGTWDSLVSVSSNSSPTSTVRRFIRYKASFATSNTAFSPRLDDVTMNACFIPSYFSAVKNAASLTSWDTFNATKLDNGGTHSFYIRSSTNPIQVNSSTPSWASVTEASVPTISTGTYFQIRDDFSITNSSQNPTLFDFTQNWFEGAASDKSYATYFDDSIWWSIASGAGATSNNTILKFDLTNTAWLKYDIPINGFYTRQNRLYFGSASTGNVFKYGDSDSDNGTAIESYWKSKDFFMSSPFTDDDVTNLSFFFKAVDNSSMTVTYAVNGSSETSYTVPLARTTASYGRNNRNLPLGTVGNTFNVKFGNDASDQPFEVFAIQYGVTPKSWKPDSQ